MHSKCLHKLHPTHASLLHADGYACCMSLVPDLVCVAAAGAGGCTWPLEQQRGRPVKCTTYATEGQPAHDHLLDW